jgi:hypothetical protein
MDDLDDNFDDEITLQWTSEAKKKLHNIPFFARTQARKQIEQFAYRRGENVITADLIEEARLDFGQ